MSPAEREVFGAIVARFYRAGGTPTFADWVELTDEERAVFVAVHEEHVSPRAFPDLDRETSEAYERVLWQMGVSRG